MPGLSDLYCQHDMAWLLANGIKLKNTSTVLNLYVYGLRLKCASMPFAIQYSRNVAVNEVVVFYGCNHQHPVLTMTAVFFIQQSTRSCCQTVYYWTPRLPCCQPSDIWNDLPADVNSASEND